MKQIKIENNGVNQLITVPENSKVTIDGKVVVFEPKFKKGDVIYWSGFNPSLGIILSECPSFPDDSYNAFMIKSMTSIDKSLKHKHIRFATDSEKQLIFDALAKEGKQWNAEKLCIEDLKVFPEVGDCVKCYDKDNLNTIFYFVCGGFDKDGDPYEKNNYRVKNKIIQEELEEIGYPSDEFIFEIPNKDQFQSELSQLGFEYNFENYTISELKWKPKEMEVIFVLDWSTRLGWNTTTHKYDTSDFDSFYNHGRVFKSEKECQQAIDKIKQVLSEK